MLSVAGDDGETVACGVASVMAWPFFEWPLQEESVTEWEDMNCGVTLLGFCDMTMYMEL
jgi:hypothetical protein